MSIQFSKTAILEKNGIAIGACEASARRLNSIVGLSVAREKKRLAQRSRAANEKTFLQQVNAHFRASGTTVKPMDDAVANELNALSNSLDIKIQNDSILNASIEFITEVLKEVSDLRSIVEDHQG